MNFQAHRLNASLVDARVPPFRMWSFQGSSYKWGKDDVMEISERFAQPNLFGPPGKDGTGGGIPVVAFWTAAMGEAVGHLEPLPLALVPTHSVRSWRSRPPRTSHPGPGPGAHNGVME